MSYMCEMTVADGDWKDSIVENSPKDLSSPPSESRSLHEQKQDAIEAEGKTLVS